MRNDYCFGAEHWRRHFGQRGWVRPTVIRVLESGPKNGIEIMEAIESMSYGWWKPSPGTIYPLLEQLVAEDIAKKDKDGKYELTDEYRKASGPTNDTEEVLTNMEDNTSYLEELAQGRKNDFSAHKARVAALAKRLSQLG